MATLYASGFAIAAAIGLLTGKPEAAAGQPMDLGRQESRWVEVQVATALPGDREPRLSAPALGWYEVGPGSTQRTVRVPGAEVERIFLADRHPVERSFSDFVWIFDARTGHVQSASFSGLVDQPIRLGPLQLWARVSIAVELSTLVTGGYSKPHPLGGQTVVGYCPDSTAQGCTAVSPSVYETATGWVRANGAVCAAWHSLRTLAYTSLGHARFQELEPGEEVAGPRKLLTDRPAGRSGAPAC